MRLAQSMWKLAGLLALFFLVTPGFAAQAGKPGKAAKKPRAKPAAKAAPPAAKEKEAPVRRRDPFEVLLGGRRGAADIPGNLPPGKAGLIPSLLRVDGLVRAPSGMIAVVTNQQQRVYFLREGDRLYNGQVERITMEAVWFRESGKDAFGNPVERQVTKRLYPSAGEQP